MKNPEVWLAAGIYLIAGWAFGIGVYTGAGRLPRGWREWCDLALAGPLWPVGVVRLLGGF